MEKHFFLPSFYMTSTWGETLFFFNKAFVCLNFLFVLELHAILFLLAFSE